MSTPETEHTPTPFWCGWCGVPLTRETEEAHVCDDDEPACDHRWLGRPESDTCECLVCGEECHG